MREESNPRYLVIIPGAYIKFDFLAMAEPEVRIVTGDDIEMQGEDTEAIGEIPETGAAAEQEAGVDDDLGLDKNAPRVTFAE